MNILKTPLTFILLILFSIHSFAQSTIQWQKCFGGKGKEDIADLKMTSDGGYVFVGSVTSNDGQVSGVFNSTVYDFDYTLNLRFNKPDLWIVKLDANKNISWTQTLGGGDADYARNVLVVNGGIIVVANINSQNGDLQRPLAYGSICVSKFSNQGYREWEVFSNVEGAQEISNAIKTNDGGFLVIGNHVNSSNRNVFLMKISSNGNREWIRSYGGVGNDIGLDAVENNGRYQILAITDSNGSGNVPAHSSTNADWCFSINTSGDDIQTSTIISTEGARRIIKTSTNYFLIGSFYSISSRKFDFNWNLLWSQSYGNGSESFTDVLDYDENSLIIAAVVSTDNGEIYGKRNEGVSDNWLIKIEKSDGSLVWQKCLGGTRKEGDINYSVSFPSYTYAFAGNGRLLLDSDRGIILGTQTISNDIDVSGSLNDSRTPYYPDAWLVKLNPESSNSFKITNINPKQICVGNNMSVYFETGENGFSGSNTFTAQLSDSNGSFINAINLPTTGINSPLTVQIPNNLNLVGKHGYKLRIISTEPTIVSSESYDFTINTSPTVAIVGDQNINQGQTTSLKLNFTGGGPYTYTLLPYHTSPTQYSVTNTFTKTIEDLTPTNSTTFSISRIQNPCGNGLALNSATIRLNYCTPSFSGYNYSTFCLNDLKIGTETGINLINLANLSCPNTFYVNDLNNIIEMTAGSTYNIYSKATTTTIYSAPFYMAVWLDYNRDDIFGQNEKIYQGHYPFADGANNLINGTFDIPNNSSVGITGMRVVTSEYNNPCLGGFVTRDFKIKILPAPPTNIQVNLNTNTILCSGTTVNIPITITGVQVPNPKYIIEISDKNGSFYDKTILQTNSTSSPLIVELPDNLPFGTNYKMKVKIDGAIVNSPSSNTFKIYYKPKATIIGSSEIIPSGTEFIFKVKIEGGEIGTFNYQTNFGGVLDGNNEVHRFNFIPNASRNYQVTSISNICGVGEPSNSINAILNNNACVSRGGVFFIPISNVFIKDSISNQTIVNQNSNVLETGYQMYDLPISLKKNNTYSFKLTASNGTFLGSPTTIYPQDVGIWIDFNEDNIFSRDELLFSNVSGNYMNPTIEGKFKIPNNVSKVHTRMRIRTTDWSAGLHENPCGYDGRPGETEDYWVTIIESDCPDNRNITEMFDGQQMNLKSKGEIRSSSIISNNSKIIFNSPKYILLENGFKVENGSVFLTEDTGCGNN